jgi:hypothetical protein
VTSATLPDDFVVVVLADFFAVAVDFVVTL